MRKLSLLFPLAICTLIWLSGCSGDVGPKMYEVKGNVTVNGKPLNDGVVFLHNDDPKQGGTSGILSSGSYIVSAAAGKYKVTVTPPERTDDSQPAAIPTYDRKYLDAKTTPLTIDVVPSPAEGAYDLKLTK